MKVYAGTVNCKSCRSVLLLKKEDVKFKIKNQYRCVFGVEYNMSTKTFLTECTICKTLIILNHENLSKESCEDALEVL